MDKHTDQPATTDSAEFAIGTPVIYSLHGKCQVIGIENRQVGEEWIRFYKLEVQKPALSRSTRHDPAIWLPVDSARDRGLRIPMTNGDAKEVLSILANREYYFPQTESWNSIYPKLEACIRTEGAIGFAKVASYLFVLKRRQVVPSAEIVRFSDNVNRLLYRELSEALGESIKVLEERINKGLRQKLLADN